VRQCKKPTAQTGTFGFADTRANAQKPKEPFFCLRSDRIARKRTKSILKNEINGKFGLF